MWAEEGGGSASGRGWGPGLSIPYLDFLSQGPRVELSTCQSCIVLGFFPNAENFKRPCSQLTMSGQVCTPVCFRPQGLSPHLPHQTCKKIKCTQNSWGPLSAWTADLSGLKGSPAGGGARARVGLILPTLPIYPSIFQDQSWLCEPTSLSSLHLIVLKIKFG